MQAIKVKITGIGSLLMHNPASMRANRGPQRGGKVIPEPHEEAKAGLYVSGGQLFLKADMFRESALIAARSFKVGKGNLVNKFASAVFLGNDLCLLYRPGGDTPITDADSDWEIDTRRVVVQKNGILRSRPKITDWECVVEFDVDPELIQDVNLIEEVLDASGKFPGVGDYRIGKKGPFGRYSAKFANGHGRGQ